MDLQEAKKESLVQSEGIITRGEVEKPPKTIGTFGILSASFNILNTWFGLGSTLVLGFANGGPVTIVYGLILISVIYGATALSLAELSARYPTAGGQYHWTSVLAPKRISRGLSYACGSVNAIGRVTICASVTVVVAHFTLGIVSYYNDSYVIRQWHVFLLYQVLNIVVLLYDIFILQQTPWTHDVAFIVSIVSFITITITCLAVANPKQPSGNIWGGFINETGWSNKGIVFLTGLVNPNYGFAGLDGAIHLAEDCLDAARTVPLATIFSLVIGVITAFFFAVAMLYCISDIRAVLSTRTGVPLYEIFAQATDSRVATTVFMVLMTSVAFLTLLGSVLAASRITWAFARDDALIWSKYIKKIDPKRDVPVWALLFNALWILIIGCIYLGSTTGKPLVLDAYLRYLQLDADSLLLAFNTIVGSGLLVEQVSFAFPAALLMWQRRAPQFLPRKGRYNLGKAGWLVNSIVIGWTCLVLVFYSFPTVKPVTAGNMSKWYNYTPYTEPV
ncbi:MAG: hypothetical protein Q9187_000741 [Circinaria calcarea]